MSKYKCNDCNGVFDGSQFSKTDWCVNPTLGVGPFDSPQDHGAGPQQSTFPNTMWDPATDGNPDEQPWSNIASEFIKGFTKIAAISGQVVNNILQGIHSSGGITYNLSQGNLTGTPTFAVALYPDREQVVDGVDFDILEGYIEQNEDLLSDANNSFGAFSRDGKVYLDIVATVSDQAQAIEMAKQNAQVAIFDLEHNKTIPIKAFSKKNLIKTAEESTLPQAYQNEIAAASSPVYVIAVNNYVESIKNGHEPQRAFDYAVESVKNLEQIDPNKLKEFIDTYVN